MREHAPSRCKLIFEIYFHLFLSKITYSEAGYALGVTLEVDHLNTVPKKEVLTVGSGATVPGCRYRPVKPLR